MKHRWLRRFASLLGLAVVTLTIGCVAVVGLALAEGYRPVVITTGSMGTTAPPESVVVAAPRPGGAVAVGDIVVMRRPGRAPVTHRVIEIESGPNGRRFAVTRGDANEAPDPGTYPLGREELVERWTIPDLGRAVVWMGNPLGALAIIMGAVSLVTVGALRWIWTAPSPERAAPVPDREPERVRRNGPRLAVGVATVMGVMSGGVAWSVFLSTDTIADNQFGTAQCFDAQVAGVQTGEVTNTSTGIQTIPVTAVAPTRSVLLTSVRSVGNEPADSAVLARLASATSIELERRTDSGSPPTIVVRWTLVEYTCGVTVQRGETPGNGTSLVDVGIASVDLATSFVMTTAVGDAADAAHDGDDDHLAVLADPTTLRLRAASGGTLPADHDYGWQVVSFDDPGDVSVQTATRTLTATDTTSVALATPTDPETTMVLAHSASAGSGSDLGERRVRAHLSSPTTVQLTRLVSGDPLEVTLQVVSFTDGTVVQHGVVDLGPGQATASVPVDPVDLSRSSTLSTVAAPGSLSGGATTMTTGDVLGEASATFVLTDATTVEIERAATTSTASFGWQVIEWGGPTWWDTDYPFRQRIDVTTSTTAAPDAYTVPVTVDHAALVQSGLARADGRDVRVLRWDGSGWIELDRILDDGATWNTSATTLWFRTTRPIGAAETDSYWLYFGNDAAPAALDDPENVWLLTEDFETGTLGDFEDRTGGTGWYRAQAWTRRIPLTIDASMADVDLIDFPVLVHVTQPDLGTNAQADADDIRFTAADGTTPLAHEIEAWDPGTGELTAWVRVPTVSSATDTTVYLYYGATDAPDQRQVTQTWGDAEAIWHLHRDPAGSAPQADDVSVRRRDGLSIGAMTGADLVDGLIGPAVDFDGVDDGLAIEPFDPSAGGLTVAGWVNADSFTAEGRIVGKATSPTARIFELSFLSDGTPRLRLRLGGSTSELTAGLVATGSWHHVAGTWDGATMRLFVDGAEVGAQPASGTLDTDASMPVTIGNTATADRGFDGRLDEVRIEAVARPEPWLATAERNQRSPGTYVTAGAAVGGTWFDQGDWSFRKPLAVDAGSVSAALTDFPVLVSFTDTELIGKPQADGDDLVFTAADGTTRLDHQLEAVDAGTGTVTAWVRVPLVDDTVDTGLFVYYGNATAQDQQDPEAVFGDQADLVLHN